MQNIEEIKSKMQFKLQLLNNIQNLSKEQFEQEFQEYQQLNQILEKLEKEKVQCNQKEIKEINLISLTEIEKQKSDQINDSFQFQQNQDTDLRISNKQTQNQINQKQSLFAEKFPILDYQNQNNSPKLNAEISKRDDFSQSAYQQKQNEQIDLQSKSIFQEQASLSLLKKRDNIKVLYCADRDLNLSNNSSIQKNNQDQNILSEQINSNQDLRNYNRIPFLQNMNVQQHFDRQELQNQSVKIQNLYNQNYSNIMKNNFTQIKNYDQRAQPYILNEKRRFDYMSNNQQLSNNQFFEDPSKKRFWNKNEFQNQQTQKRQQVTVFYDRDSNYNIFDNHSIQKNVDDQQKFPNSQSEKKQQENDSIQEIKQQIEGNLNQQIDNSLQNNIKHQGEIKNLENVDNQEIQEDNQNVIKLTRNSNDLTIVINQQSEQLKKKGFVKDNSCQIQYLKYLLDPRAEIKYDAFFEENYEIKMKKEKGQSIHTYVADLFRNNHNMLKFCNSLSQNQKQFLQHYVQVIKDYISIRDMKVTGIEGEFKSEGETKRYDLLAENEKEALIFDWKFSNQDAYYKILVDYQEHFLNQVKVLQQIYTNKIVRICILPLQEIKQIKFVEFEYQDIQNIQINQAKDPIFQKSMLKIFLKNLKDEPKLKDEYSYNAQGQAITVQQQVDKIIQDVDIKQIEYYIDLNNSDELLFKQDSQNSFKKISNKKQFNQFYYIHLLLCQKLSQNNNLQLNEQILDSIQKTMKNTNQIIQKNNLNEETISNHLQQQQQQQQQQHPQPLQQSPQSFKSLSNSVQPSPESNQWSPQSFQQRQHPLQLSSPPFQQYTQAFEQQPHQYQQNPALYNQYQQFQNPDFDYAQHLQYGSNQFYPYKQYGNYQRQYSYGNQHFYDKY
ncbi:hypothetical protein TTHERM_00079130 (macronuclear) [Tetrahymena thermophila SB210]|uniref:Uncharacterized protein n=1 Tax=Tetrahymena thermophila (strain SB210) TaxID=312017 RepID=Q23FV1_TETTS|nr:hypothetical protein TTHERM_00079130 [Tetrahymena thermophila SB210]EAR95509.2 hypothetical protein TTHERM_00079130 [Tetrahymena thermophila SB210]|eukprot:XP_001015754.2 hypothetical protein TTHERM_00079130 [Tetrahymena thermophila SB210]